MRDQDNSKEQLTEELSLKSAEEALKKERQQLLSIFDSINEVISVVDVETYEILFSNKFMKERHGKELIGGLCFKELHGVDRPCSHCVMAMARRLEGEPYRWEYHNPTNNRDYLATERIIKWTDGRDAKFHLGIDITERKITEEALKESEASFRALSEHTFEAIFLSEKGVCIGQNRAAERMFGYSNEEAVGKPGIEWIAPEHRELVGKNIVRDYAPPYEVIALRKDGTTFPCEIQAKMIDPERRIRVTSLRNITERKKAEKALRESESRYRVLFDNSPDGILIADIATKRFTYANPSVCRMLGYSKEELTRLGVADIHPQDRLPQLIAEFDAQARGEKILAPNIPCLRKDGTVFYADISTTPTVLDGMACNVGFFRDITERKWAEEALKASEDRYRQMTEGSLTGIFIHQDGIAVFVNQRLANMLGYTKEEMIGRKVFDRVHPEDGDAVGAIVLARLRKELSVVPQQLRLLKKTGEAIWCEVLATRIDYQGRPAVMGNLVEITDRKKAEEALRESEERYRVLFQDSRDAVYVTTRDGRFLDANQAFCDLFGWDRHQLDGLKVERAYADPAHRKVFQESIAEAGSLKDYPIQLRKKDGTLFEAALTASLRRGDKGDIVGYQGIIRDMTEKRVLEKQLIQAQKMEAMGTLAGGIAHDFNNILQVVLGFAELVITERGRDWSGYEELRSIRSAAERGADLVRRILTFSRKIETNMRPLNLNAEVLQAEKLLYRTIPKMIAIRSHLADDLKVINADPSQVEQILLNLAVNAKDAMPEGGDLAFQTKNIVLDDRYRETHPDVQPGEYVQLTVTDNGHGMEEHVVAHIFEPFYTTKAAGEGTGLGLSVVFGIVKMHGGHIECESEKGKGTTFKIHFPVIEGGTARDVADSRELPAFGTETVLVVDDEKLIVQLAQRLLERAGYTVLTASSGKEAVHLYAKERSHISLVILDLIMPEMGGKECLEELLKIDPQVKALVASGFAVSGETKTFIDASARGLVSKPFKMRQLLQTVRHVLDEE